MLPLVPPYLTFIAGTTIEELVEERQIARARRDVLHRRHPFRSRAFRPFSWRCGATASVFGQMLRAHLHAVAFAGSAIIAMGLHFSGFSGCILYREKRLEVEKPFGLWGAYVMGLAFAFGWTPCIGPILAAILAVAPRKRQRRRAPACSRSIRSGSACPFCGGGGDGALHRLPEGFRAHFGTVESVVGVRWW